MMLINGYYPRIGGAERVLTALAPVLQSLDVDVHIATRRFPGLKSFDYVNGVPVHRLPVPGSKAVASLSYTFSALALAKKIQPDILHAHDLFSTTTTSIVYKRRFGVPVVATIHRSGPLGDLYRLGKKLLGNKRWHVFARSIDGFNVISTEIDQELAQRGVPARKRFYVSNGIDVERFTPLSKQERREQRKRLALPDETVPIVVFIGRLAPEKRVDSLLSVWGDVREAVPQAMLLVLGDGPEATHLRHAAPSGVRFLGAVDDVVPYLQSVDLFVLPSVAEGLSVAALEAQAAGLPVLLTAVGGAQDIVKHGESGWLVPPEDKRALQIGLITCLKGAALRARMAATARDQVVREHSLRSVASRLKGVYCSVGAPGQG